MTGAADKAALRGLARLTRAKLAVARPDASREIVDKALMLLDFPPNAAIAGYAAIGDEIDPLPLLRVLAAGHVCALPRVEGARALSFRRWRPGDALTAGPYGIPAPSGELPEVAPDIVLTPLLAFDGDGYRLGYGGGYYDAALAAMRLARPILAVGLAFAGQQMAHVARESWDQPLDLVVTEQGLVCFTDKGHMGSKGAKR